MYQLSIIVVFILEQSRIIYGGQSPIWDTRFIYLTVASRSLVLSHTVYPLSKKHVIYMSVGQGREEKKEKGKKEKKTVQEKQAKVTRGTSYS